MFTGINQQKFYQSFKTDDDCRQFLYALKWAKGYSCRRCQNSFFWKGRTEYHTRCTRCDYDESVTANTVFHKIKIPLIKAFAIAFHVTAFKKGISCNNLSKIVNVGLKAVWLFRRKLQDSMGACVSAETEKAAQMKHCNIDGIILTHRLNKLNGLQQVKVILQKQVARPKNRLIRCKTIDSPLPLELCSLVAGRYINKGKELLIWNFKAWLTGTHHHCSEKYLNGYLNEYCFRFNYRRKESCIWHSLMVQMMHPKLPVFRRKEV